MQLALGRQAEPAAGSTEILRIGGDDADPPPGIGMGECIGRIRRFLPSNTDIALLSDEEIQAVADLLNSTPQKCLGYRAPHEVLDEQITFLKAG